MGSVESWLTRLAIVSTVVLAAAWTAGIGAAQSPSTVPSPTTGPALQQVVSDDGRLTLSIPVGAAPDGVTLSATKVPTLVPSIAAYELQPVDVALATRAHVTWRLEPAGAPAATAGDLVWLGMARADDAAAGPWEWLDDPHIAVVDGGYTLTGLLSRFGTLAVTQLATRIHGPEAIWGPGYAPGRGIPIDLDLTLVDVSGGPAGAAFSGDWRFVGGYPERIAVSVTVAEAERLRAVWQCQLPGATSLATTFGVRESADTSGPATRLLGLPPAAATFAVSFQVACGTMHPEPDG